MESRMRRARADTRGQAALRTLAARSDTLPTMPRRLVALLLAFCLCWQSLAFAGVEVLVRKGEAQQHALMHFEGQAHHHHDEHGGVHKDASGASTQHAMDDACMFCPALIQDLRLTLPMLRPDAPLEALASEPALPFLPAFERPPKPTI